MSVDPPAIRVFISHQWRDKQLADRLARELEPLADVWIDYRRLRPGDRIQDTIDEALGSVDIVLVLWTQHSAASANVQAEVESSVALGLRVVPCILSYDEDGNPHPHLRDPLAAILGIDFHHYGSGLAQVAELILQLQEERAPQAARLGDHPGVRMLTYLKGYLNYLANYRSLRGVDDERAEWTDRIVSEIERYVEAGGDPSTVRGLLGAAQDSAVDDRDGIGLLVERLEPLVGGGARTEQTIQPGGVNRVGEQASGSPPSPDALRDLLVSVVPAGTEDTWAEQVNSYIALAPPMLRALTDYAQATGSPAGMEVVRALQAYLDEADDLIPAHAGPLGHLDDAWLIVNTAYRLLESGLVPPAVVPANWPAIATVDSVVCALLPQNVLSVLTDMVFQLLQLIVAEVSSYEPSFTPAGHGYTAAMGAAPAGGSWEDRMNSRLLGTGLSVDGGLITH